MSAETFQQAFRSSSEYQFSTLVNKEHPLNNNTHSFLNT